MGDAKLSNDELLALAKLGYVTLKTETNNHGELFAVLQIINTLATLEVANEEKGK